MARLSKPWKELQHLVQSYASLKKVSKEMLVSGLRREGYGDFKGEFYASGDLTQPIAVDTVAQKIASYLKRPEPFREIRDYDTRKEAKRSKLSLALAHDDPSDAKSSLASYFAFLQENPLINIGTSSDECGRYLDTIIQSVPERRTVLTFLDTLEKVIVEGGEYLADSFCKGAPRLYASLSSERVNIFVEKGIELAKGYQQLPAGLSKKKREQEKEKVQNYFNLSSELAGKNYCQSLQEEMIQLLRKGRQEQRGAGEKLEQLTRQLTVVAELRQEVSDYSGKLIQAERDRGVLKRDLEEVRGEKYGWKSKFEFKDRELLQKDNELQREKTLRRRSLYFASVIQIMALLVCGTAIYYKAKYDQANVHPITIPTTK